MQAQKNLTNVPLVNLSDMLAGDLPKRRDSLGQVLYHAVCHVEGVWLHDRRCTTLMANSMEHSGQARLIFGYRPAHFQSKGGKPGIGPVIDNPDFTQ